MQDPATTTRSGDDRDVRAAWWALALVPVGFLVATLTGDGLLTLLGYDPATDRIPIGSVLAAGLPALAVLLAAPAAAVGFGRRALQAGEPRGRRPAVLGALIGAGLVALNIAAYLWG